MATFAYLWNNRVRFKFGSGAFFKVWAKRVLSLGELLHRNRKRSRLTGQGAIISETAELGAVIANGNKGHLKIGDFSFIGQVELALHDRIEIGNYVCVNDGVKLLSASHKLDDPMWSHKKAPIVIDDYAWIATNAIILPGVRIGEGAVVGAGAVVSKDVAAYSIVTGNPAQAIAKSRTRDLNYNPCEFLAANRAWLVG